MLVGIVVGYSTITLRNGALGTGASFKTIAKEGMRLSEIIPTGYENQSTWYNGSKATGFKDMITIQVLNAGGDVAVDSNSKRREFMFARSGKNGAWTEEGYWHRNGDSTKITADNDEIFDVGEGLWISVAGTAYSKTGCGPDQFKLMNNGEALLDAANITLRNGAVMVIPTLSADMKLSKIIPTGYEEQSTWYNGSKATGFKDMITIQVLNAGGDVAVDSNSKRREFMFARAGKNGAWTEEGYWHRNGESTKITSDNDEIFKMGEALWVSVAGTAYSKTGCGPDQFKLQFPGIDDTYVTEE